MSRTNMHSVMLIVLAAVCLAFATGVAPHAQSKAELALKAAIDKEVVDGDLKAAIDLYRKIAQGSDRAVAARALVRMGQCYEKLGSREAQKAYEQVLKDYADQPEAAGIAQARLAALRRAAAEPHEPTIRARRLLSGHYPSEVEISGAPTPDGRSLVHIDSTLRNLAVRDLQTGASRLITNRSSENGYVAQSAIVSPDGRRIAYAWQWHASPQHPTATMELRIVGTDGSGDRLLREERRIWPGSWSSDGRLVAVTIPLGEERGTEIACISVADGSKASLGTFPSAGKPSFSPDDRFVAVQFRVDDRSQPDISLLPAEGGSTLPLVVHPADDKLVGWIPGTTDLLFTSDRSGNRDLWAIRVSKDGRGGAPRPVRRGVGEMAPMGFTRDGSLVYSIYTLQYNIFIAPFDEASGQVRVSEAKPLGGRGSNMTPSWSPDGRYLAFARRRPSPPGRGFGGKGYEEIVHVLDTQTGEERALAEPIAPATIPPPTWFPDGRSLLVLGMPQTDGATSADRVPSAAYRIDLVTGAATRLFDFPPDRNWWFGKDLVASPDGEGVIYASDGRLVLRHLESVREEQLYRHPDLATGILSLTPDGSELVFGIADSAVAGQQPRIWLQQGGRLLIMPSRGGDAREIVKFGEPCQVTDVAWTSDGQSLLFFQRDEKGRAVMRVPRKGGKAERLWETQERMLGLSPSPDGRRVAYFTQENEAEIWVMENIKEVLARGR
jgi:Tol biopolymer transport system component